MNCDKTKEQLISYLLDTLNEEEKGGLKTHFNLSLTVRKHWRT